MVRPPIPTLAAHGAEMPAIGFGTSGLGDCGEIVAAALEHGYRHIDTAWKYGSERGVGEGIRAAGVPRAEIFLTTKVSHEYLRADDFARSVDESPARLGVDHVDLLLSEDEMRRIAALARRDGRIADPAGRAPAWD